MQNPYVLVHGAYTSQQPIRIQNDYTVNRISVRGGNACGVGIQNIKEFVFNPACNGGSDVEYLTLPRSKPIEPINIPEKFVLQGNIINTVLSLQIPSSMRLPVIIIRDINGRIEKKMACSSMNVKVDVSSFSAGMYSVTLLEKERSETLRFIKQ